MTKKTFTLNLDGKDYIVETGQLAQQTNGSCTVRVGDTIILATACMKRKPSDLDFFPLSVSYQEKYYASGTITSNRFRKREGRPPDDKILTGRLIDRGLRPLFPKGFNHDTQTILTILSYDRVNFHDTIGGLATSVAFSISDIPFFGPNVLVRVGIINGDFVLNPTVEQMAESKLDLLVTCSKENIVMIEAGAKIVDEDTILKAMEFALEKGKKICEFIETIAKEIGKPKIEFIPKSFDKRISPEIKSNYADKIKDIIFNDNIGKLERFAEIDDLKEEATENISEKLNSGVEDDNIIPEKDIKEIFGKVVKDVIREQILKNGKRIKGRALDEIRPLSCEVGLLPRTHGSGLFQRGETQGLSIATLGGPGAKQLSEGMEGESEQRYYHHYNFPPYSVGEVNNRLFTGNREIGHGALAEKALLPVLPDENEFPYVVRVVTEIIASNGSSSMAAVCGSTLSLMDAGVPIKEPVSGIAMGLMTDLESGEYKILTDLQDEEDFGGDMDFKVAGTKDGITAIQMDIKLTGIPMNIFREAFDQAKKGRLKVLESMISAIGEPRKNLSQYAPRLIAMKIDKDDIKIVIGKGGETIQKITRETGVKIDISDDGDLVITAETGEAGDAAQAMVAALVVKPEIGLTYEGEVKKIMDFGAFVEFVKGTDGLVHVSMISKERVNDVNDVLKVGQKVKVKLMEKDNLGRYKLSMKDVEE